MRPRPYRSLVAVLLGLGLVLGCADNIVIEGDTNAPKSTSTTTAADTTDTDTPAADTTDTDTPAADTPDTDTTDTDTTAPSAEPETYVHEPAGVSVTIPAGWTRESTGDNDLTATAADGSVTVMFLATGLDTMDEVLNVLGDELDKVIDDVAIDTEPTADTLNGIDCYHCDGSGTIDGAAISWAVTLLARQRPVIVLAFAATGLWEANEAAVTALVQSIQPIEPGTGEPGMGGDDNPPDDPGASDEPGDPLGDEPGDPLGDEPGDPLGDG